MKEDIQEMWNILSVIYNHVLIRQVQLLLFMFIFVYVSICDCACKNVHAVQNKTPDSLQPELQSVEVLASELCSSRESSKHFLSQSHLWNPMG